MGNNKLETTRSVEEIIFSMENTPNNPKLQNMREFALRITEKRKEANEHLRRALISTVFLTPLSWAIGTILISTTLMSEDPTIRALGMGIGILTFGGSMFCLESGAKDFTAASLARGEVQSLTTVLASQIIAESPTNSK